MQVIQSKMNFNVHSQHLSYRKDFITHKKRQLNNSLVSLQIQAGSKNKNKILIAHFLGDRIALLIKSRLVVIFIKLLIYFLLPIYTAIWTVLIDIHWDGDTYFFHQKLYCTLCINLIDFGTAPINFVSNLK